MTAPLDGLSGRAAGPMTDIATFRFSTDNLPERDRAPCIFQIVAADEAGVIGWRKDPPAAHIIQLRRLSL
jgi:hypothetical protein